MPLNIKCKDCRDFVPAPNLPHKGVCKRMVLRCDPDEIRGCGCFYPASNADRIRGMTDEELAEWLRNVITGGSRCPCNEMPGLCEKPCKECLFDWLKSPVEVDNV